MYGEKNKICLTRRLNNKRAARFATSLDEYDPYAACISYPPYQFGQEITEKLGLVVDLEQREWYLPTINNSVAQCKIWSSEITRRDMDPIQCGNRLSASLSFLQHVCLVLECEIIFKIQINRRYKQSYYNRSGDEDGYRPPHNRIYAFSKDGKLRDTEMHYQLRERTR